ncbi:hypothetical protein PG985_001483 [Apiospora marii]|uniref:Glycine transporter domain-containing protein n=1 Tax=Apiospora marii TaxID=335849 RepID=A0ABR1RI22_9PEZI
MSELTDGVGLGVVLNEFEIEIAICIFGGEAAAVWVTEHRRINVLVGVLAGCFIGSPIDSWVDSLVNAMGAIVFVLGGVEEGLGTLAPPLGPVSAVHDGQMWHGKMCAVAIRDLMVFRPWCEGLFSGAIAYPREKLRRKGGPFSELSLGMKRRVAGMTAGGRGLELAGGLHDDGGPPASGCGGPSGRSEKIGMVAVTLSRVMERKRTDPEGINRRKTS